jgi:serine/threonine protein kinase
MLTKSGAKLMDFGLAKQSSVAPLANAALTEMTVDQAKLTSEGLIVGTFQYMAPEQLKGKEVDARTDIFAFGELIHEMATGKPAFSGKSRASLIAAILTTEPPAITQLQPLTPMALEQVVKKCLAKDPDERWQVPATWRWSRPRIAPGANSHTGGRNSPRWGHSGVYWFLIPDRAFAISQPVAEVRRAKDSDRRRCIRPLPDPGLSCVCAR